jgi:hypothetical protein
VGGKASRHAGLLEVCPPADGLDDATSVDPSPEVTPDADPDTGPEDGDDRSVTAYSLGWSRARGDSGPWRYHGPRGRNRPPDCRFSPSVIGVLRAWCLSGPPHRAA